MTAPIDTVREFYAAIADGDSGKMVSLMAPDIEWISVVDFNVHDGGPAEVMEKVSPCKKASCASLCASWARQVDEKRPTRSLGPDRQPAAAQGRVGDSAAG